MKIGIPALAGLSVLHGLVPPHPGPLAAVAALKADLGLTLAFGLIISIPTVMIAGPIFGSLVSRFIPGEARASSIGTPATVPSEASIRAAPRTSGPHLSDGSARRVAVLSPSDGERRRTPRQTPGFWTIGTDDAAADRADASACAR